METMGRADYHEATSARCAEWQGAGATRTECHALPGNVPGGDWAYGD